MINKSNNIELNSFENPPYEYRPVVFWSWNETMNPQAIREQIRDMADAGMGGGFIHSRIGLLTEYLSEQWFAAVDAVVDESRKLGMKIYLYDEDKWPSGFAGGAVPLENENYRMKVLLARPVGTAAPEGAAAIGEPQNKLQVYSMIMPLGFAWFNGTTYGDLLSKEAMRFFIERSYQSYYERYGKYYGDDIVCEFTDEPCTIFRGTVPGGAVPYTFEMHERFEQMHGYELTANLYKLFTDGNESEKFRIDYFRTINDLFENNFSKQIGQWCEQHKIGLTGHYMLEGSVYGQQLWGTKVMPNYRHQHMPGIDHLGLQVEEIITAKQTQSVVNQFGKERMLSEMFGCSGQDAGFVDRLWIASQQIQLGVNLINPHLSLYTMSGCRKRDFPPNIFYQQPWWSANSELDIPLSRLCYSMSRGTYISDILLLHPQESTFALWQTDCENCSNDISWVSFDWDSGLIKRDKAAVINDIEQSINELIKKLLDNQLHFDFGDETIIAQDGELVELNDGPAVRIGRMQYRTVIIPQAYTISEKTVKLLSEFKEKGGAILVHENAPRKVDAMPCPELEKLYAGLAKFNNEGLVDAAGRQKGIDLVAENGTDRWVWTHPRKLDKGKTAVLVTNLNRDREFKGKLRVKGDFRSAELLDHFTGRTSPVEINTDSGAAAADIELAPVQSRLIIFSPEPPIVEQAVSLVSTEPGEKVVIDPKEFDVERLDENALILDYAYFDAGRDGFSDKPMPVIAIQEMLNAGKYDGPLKLKYEFNVNGFDPEKKLTLVAEHPERYFITVNGSGVQYEDAGSYRDMNFMKIDITGRVVDGRNEIVFDCRDFAHGDQTRVDDYFGRYGTEIESVYLLGDFSINCTEVQGKYDPSHWQNIGVTADLVFVSNEDIELTGPRAPEFNNITASGLPFYAGSIKYTASLPELKKSEKGSCFLEFEKLHAPCAEIFVDNQKVGSIFAPPFKLDTGRYYKPGAKLEIVLHSSLRNLLGPHHNTAGEIPWVSPNSFVPEFEKGVSFIEGFEKWQKGQISPTNWQDCMCLRKFGDIGAVKVFTTG